MYHAALDMAKGAVLLCLCASRFLASFEAEPTRCAAIHKLRTARLTSVCGDCLSSEHYLPQIRAVELECANAWRDCLDARETLAADTKVGSIWGCRTRLPCLLNGL